MSHNFVPRFGNWENEDDVSYKPYFANAIKFEVEKGLNPNNSQGVPKPIATLTPGEGTEGEVVKPIPEHFKNESPIVRPLYNPPARNRNMDQCSQNYSSPRPTQCRRPSPGFEKIFQMPDRGQADVPKFGDWDENPTRLYENLVNMFDRLRADRDASPVPAPRSPSVSSTPKHPSHSPHDDKQQPIKKKTCCFPWF